MATVTSPIITDATGQDIVDGLSALANAVKPSASNIPYTNTTSGLSATNVQGAIDEVVDRAYPDYANVQTLHTGNNDTSNITSSGTIAQDGYLQVKVNIGATAGAPFIRISINRVTVYEFQNKYAQNYLYANTPLMPVKKGDIYTAITGSNQAVSGTYGVFFYPTR